MLVGSGQARDVGCYYNHAAPTASLLYCLVEGVLYAQEKVPAYALGNDAMKGFTKQHTPLLPAVTVTGDGVDTRCSLAIQ